MYCDEKPSSHMKRLTMKHYDHCDFVKIIYNAISYYDSTASGNSVRDTLFSAYCQSFNVIIIKMQYFIQ